MSDRTGTPRRQRDRWGGCQKWRICTQGDPTLEAVIDAEWGGALETLRVPVEVVDWRGDDDVGAVVDTQNSLGGALGAP